VSSVEELERAAAATWSSEERTSIAGWTVVSNGGFTRRANCATPTAAAALDPDVWAAISSWLGERNASLVVRITPLVMPTLVTSVARSWGLGLVDETIVMTKTLDSGAPGRSMLVDAGEAEFATRLLALNGRPADAIAPWTRMVARLGKRATGIEDEESAVGFAAVHDGFVAIYSVAVAETHRRQSRATDIMRTAESWAITRDARIAFLQVRSDNGSALAMYRGLGYVERYRYHYLQPLEATV
jgi:ribosomal protein S18 acetylase RimI-like enzyme